MPTYDYECEQCGHVFEAFQSMSASLLETCPKCEGPVHRLIGTGAGLIFKGSGFYATDYRSDSYTKAAKADASPPATEKKKKADAGSKKKKES